MTSGAYPKFHQRKDERNARLYQDWRDGMTYVELGRKYGITPQRSQIVAKSEHWRRLEREAAEVYA